MSAYFYPRSHPAHRPGGGQPWRCGPGFSGHVGDAAEKPAGRQQQDGESASDSMKLEKFVLVSRVSCF